MKRLAQGMVLGVVHKERVRASRSQVLLSELEEGIGCIREVSFSPRASQLAR